MFIFYMKKNISELISSYVSLPLKQQTSPPSNFVVYYDELRSGTSRCLGISYLFRKNVSKILNLFLFLIPFLNIMTRLGTSITSLITGFYYSTHPCQSDCVLILWLQIFGIIGLMDFIFLIYSRCCYHEKTEIDVTNHHLHYDFQPKCRDLLKLPFLAMIMSWILSMFLFAWMIVGWVWLLASSSSSSSSSLLLASVAKTVFSICFIIVILNTFINFAAMYKAIVKKKLSNLSSNLSICLDSTFFLIMC